MINSTTRWKAIALSLGTLLAGVLLLLVYAFNEGATPEGKYLSSWQSAILQELASVLIISGTLSIVSEFFLRNDFIKEVKELEADVVKEVNTVDSKLTKEISDFRTDISNEIHLFRSEITEGMRDSEERIRLSMWTSDTFDHLGTYGIVDCVPSSESYSFSNFIAESRELSLCLNDSRSWLSSNMESLKIHMQKPGSRTNVILVNPGGLYAKIIADKTRVTLNSLSEKIKEAIRKWIEAYQMTPPPKGDLRIYWHDLAVMHALYLSDKRALVTPYTISRPRANVPLFTYANAGNQTFYQFAKHDIESLLQDVSIKCVFQAENGKISVLSEDIKDDFLTEILGKSEA